VSILYREAGAPQSHAEAAPRAYRTHLLKQEVGMGIPRGRTPSEARTANSRHSIAAPTRATTSRKTSERWSHRCMVLPKADGLLRAERWDGAGSLGGSPN
jgi:hypothetical protein